MQASTRFVIRRKGTDLYCESNSDICRPEVPFEAAFIFSSEHGLDKDDLAEDEEAVEVKSQPGAVIDLPEPNPIYREILSRYPQ